MILFWKNEQLIKINFSRNVNLQLWNAGKGNISGRVLPPILCLIPAQHYTLLSLFVITYPVIAILLQFISSETSNTSN